MSVLQPDAEYFRVDLPNSGEVILSKALDFETKNQLSVTIHASVSGRSFDVAGIGHKRDETFKTTLSCHLRK